MSNYRQFGIELECFNPPVQYVTSGNNIQNAIRAMGYVAKFQQHHHFATEYDKWQIKPDSSLSQCPNALEVVSRTLPGTEASLVEVRKIADWLNGNGYEVNKYCGFHVHLDAGDLSSYECAAVALRYNHLRSDFDSIMPRSRRAGECVWARPLAAGTLNKVVNAVSSMNRTERWNEGERYVAVNLQHVAKARADRRIEFRQHSGTVSADKVIGWYKFLCDFIAETLRILRANGGSVTPTTTTQPIIRRQRTARGQTRSVVVGTTQAPRIPNIDVDTDYDLFLRFIASHGVVTQNDARSLGWPETRLRVTAHWLRRHGAELVTTQRNGELAYVGANGATTRAAIFTNPAQIRQRVTAPMAPASVAPAYSAPAVASRALLGELASAPILQGIGAESVAWFNARRAQIALARP
jgi:hypothetical protein